MKRNVAGQIIGAQLISKTDGSAVTTGTTTVYVTGDGGTQAAGSVGSGACTHEGNGYWTYAPAQAETDYAQIGFTFVNTSACNVTVQVYPTFPQTGDGFARLGAPAGASVSADVAAIKTETGTIQADTNDIQTRLPTALVSGRMDSSVGAMAANTITAAATAADFTTEVTAGLAQEATLTTIASYIDTEVAAIKAKTDNLPASPAAVGSAMTLTSAYDFAKGTVAMTEDYAADGAAATPAQLLYMLWSLMAEKNISSTTLTAKKLDGSTTAMTFTLNDATSPTSITRAT